MFTLIKNVECFCPEYRGIKDIFIVKDVIYKISDAGEFNDFPKPVNVYECKGLKAFPGIIDGHVHIIGGGGEEGPRSRINEISAEEIFSCGVTTTVGLLGADNRTKSLFSLYAKARALEEQGISTYIYSGSYEVPLITFTGNLTNDILLIDKVIGAGEIAVSDRRSSYPDVKAMLDISSQAYIGGLLSGKAGLVHLHMGDGAPGLSLLEKLLAESEFTKDMFLPTHINRSEKLFGEGINYALAGGNIDLTSGEKEGLAVPDAVLSLIKKEVDMRNVTVSSDANASTCGCGISRIKSLFEDIRECITGKHINPSSAFSLVTKNPAERLKIYPKKGALTEGSDADILITDENYEIIKVFSMGKLTVGNR